MENTATIDLSGRRYDAVTGVMLGPSSAPPLRLSGRNIDGFFRARATATPQRTTAKGAPTVRRLNHTRAHTPQAAASRSIAVRHSAVRPQTLEVRRRQPNHVRHHAQQRSRTLRRDAVPAPAPSTHNLLSPKHALQHKVPGAVALKTSAVSLDAGRLARAQSVHQSPFVTRHGRQSGLVPTFAPLAVQPLPTPTDPPAPVPGSGEAPVPPSPQPTNKPDLFEQAIANAGHYVDFRSHTAAYKKRARLHVASMAAGSLVLVIAAAFVAYQNNPALQLKLASIRSGVSSSLPNLSDSGLTYTSARAGDSRLTFGFQGTDGALQLTQTTTNLNDAELIETIGSTNASGTPAYQSVMAGNTMVYRFSNTTATWVSNGKWYTLSGSTAISDQRVKTIVEHI